ncbi:unnamed protein product [Lactuca virosa]|uniref:Transcriptional coactivator Hfi1/Transcriptional adapter 1 n=1 Tax=Lactuca virosa TaxID=75947 RepID=A0AAU9MR61_9ASTR|nr:unnamed protein product [Lactuca virosa]
MEPQQKHSRINLADMKDQLTRKLGPERSKQYFDYLKRFLSLKLNKIEFDKLCLRTIGRDNLSLHNQLIQSLLKNASTRKPPPPPPPPPPKVHHENGSVTVTAPLGIPCGARKVSSNNRKYVTVFDTGGLMDTIRLKERMDQITAAQGLQGVSMDCASVLNKGLDAYLKGLIGCFGNFRTPVKQHFGSLGRSEEHEEKQRICLLDFRVAMEVSPRQLGEDWPFLLEKICNCTCTHAFQE